MVIDERDRDFELDWSEEFGVIMNSSIDREEQSRLAKEIREYMEEVIK